MFESISSAKFLADFSELSITLNSTSFKQTAFTVSDVMMLFFVDRIGFCLSFVVASIKNLAIFSSAFFIENLLLFQLNICLASFITFEVTN